MPATHVGVLLQPPASVQTGSTFSLQVDAEDSYGNTDPTYNGSLSVAIITNPGGGTLSGTLTVTAVNGVATFTGLSISQPGTGYKLIVASPGINSGSTQTFNVTGTTSSPPPTVTQVLVDGTTWSNTFLTSLQMAGQGNDRLRHFHRRGTIECASLGERQSDRDQFQQGCERLASEPRRERTGKHDRDHRIPILSGHFYGSLDPGEPGKRGHSESRFALDRRNAVKDSTGNSLDGEWITGTPIHRVMEPPVAISICDSRLAR